MNKTIYLYVLEPVNIDEDRYQKVSSFYDDFNSVATELYSKERNERKEDLKRENKIIYLSNYRNNDVEKTIYAKLTSARYNSVRNVVNTETLEDRKNLIKSKSDGEEENNHIAIKFLKSGKAVCLYESNYYGVGFSKIIRYFEKLIKKWHKDKDDFIYYNINYRNIVSRNFLASLENVKRVKAVTLEVEKKALGVSDQKAFAGRTDLSRTADIVFKPSGKGATIWTDTVKDFYKMYNSSDSAVISVTVDAESANNEPIKFNTEEMKEKVIKEVDTNARGEVDTECIYTAFDEVLERFK